MNREGKKSWNTDVEMKSINTIVGVRTRAEQRNMEGVEIVFKQRKHKQKYGKQQMNKIEKRQKQH